MFPQINYTPIYLKKEPLILQALICVLCAIVSLTASSQLVISDFCVKKCQHSNSPFTENTDYIVLENLGESSIYLYEWSISNGRNKPRIKFKKNSYSVVKPKSSTIFFLLQTPNPSALPISISEGDQLYLYNKDTLNSITTIPKFLNSGNYHLDQVAQNFVQKRQEPLECDPLHPTSANQEIMELHISADSHKIIGPLGVLSSTQKNEEIRCCLSFNTKDTLIQTQALLSPHSPDGDEQKSIELHLLSSFDNSLVNLPQPFLSSNPRTFVLRNGGEDGFFEGKSGIRNALGATMFNSIQSSRKQQIPSPIHVFINHSYFGLYWMYQKINENALPEAKMVLKRSSKSVNTRKAFKGSWESYEEQELALLQITDTSSSFLSQFGSTWDTDNFIAYHFFQQFIGNQDRFSNNLKVWQSKKDNLWRYLLWDIDWGYGLWDSISPSGSPKWNALAFQLSDNAGWTKTSETQLFQHAMKNDDFKNLFITRSFDYLNFECSEENHLKVIQNLTKTIENNLDQQFQLYKGNFSSWQNELAKIENYVHQRHQHHSIHLAQFIQDSLVELNLTQNHRSTILINGKQLNNEELIYPSNCKLHLLPLRKDEESFLMWSDSITLLSRWVTAKGSLPYPLYTASKNEDQLVISEVNTAPNYSSRKEHLEISNSSNLPVLLYGYSISDGNNTQHFQIDDFIEPQSTKRFDYLEFNLNKNGEELVLRNAKGKLVDAWDYSFEAFTRTNHDYLYFKENNNQQFILSKETMAWMLNWSSEEITLYTLQGKKTTEPLAGHYFIRRNNQLVAIRILD